MLNRLLTALKRCANATVARSTRRQRAVGSGAASQDAASASLATFVYVDGFNVYNRLLLQSPQFKWLDLKALAASLLVSENRITFIGYYTAPVSGKIDRLQPKRQSGYISALKGHIPELEVYKGKFLHRDVLRPLSRPLPDGRLHYVRVRNTHEKGSDVNLASHLLRDAFLKRFDVALVISQDTDLVEPIRIAVQDAGAVVGVACPERVPERMRAVASFVRQIHASTLVNLQLPANVRARTGRIVDRPSEWMEPQPAN